MKILKSSLLAAAAMFVSISVQAQTADEVINKYLDAIGGRAVISQVKSLYIENETAVMGSALSGNVSLLVGKGYKTETDFNGQKIIQCVTDNGGWMINPMSGNAAPQSMPDELYNEGKDNLQIGAPLINYAENGSKVELVGKETLDSMSVYKLKLTDKNNDESDFYIDANTYYLVKITKTLASEQIDVTVTFSNYQKTAIGYVLPFTSEVSMSNGTDMTITIKKIVVNQEIDPKIFEKPVE